MPPSAKNEVLQIVQVLYRHDICHIYGNCTSMRSRWLDIVSTSSFFCIYAPRSQGLQKHSQKKPLSILIFTEQASQ